MQVPLGSLRLLPAQAVAPPVLAGQHRPALASANVVGLRQTHSQRRGCAAPRVAMRDGLGDIAESDFRADQAETADAETAEAGQGEEQVQEEYELVPLPPVGFTDEELEEIANQPSVGVL